MAQLLAQEEKEKTTALKGKPRLCVNTCICIKMQIQLWMGLCAYCVFIYLFNCLYINLFSRFIVQDRFRRADEKRRASAELS